MNNSINSILKEAKTKLEGQLWPLNKAMLAYLGIYLLLAIPSLIIERTASQGVALFSSLLFELLLIPLLTYPVMMGVICLGIERAREHSIRVGSILGHYNKMWPLYGFQVIWFLAFIILICACALLALALASAEFTLGVTIVVILTALTLGAIGIYTCFTAPLIVEKNLGVFGSIRRSIQAMRTPGKFFLMVRFLLLLSMWTFLGFFTLGIIYFWIFPKYIIAFGIIYRDLFDAQSEAPELEAGDYESPLSKYSQ